MTRRKILIVEDDVDIVRGLDIRLKASGYDVVSAADGASAIRVAQKENPDLVILDLGLPGEDGYSFIERLNSLNPQTPIIILTGRDASADKQRSLKAGAKAFLQKPMDNEELLATIQKVLEESYGAKEKPPSAK